MPISLSPWRIWWLAARPHTLGAALAPVLIGTVLAVSEKRWDPWTLLAALLGALLIQIGTNFANDYFDCIKGADTAARIGPIRATQAGLVSLAAMRFAFMLTFAAVLIPGAYLVLRGGWPIVWLGIASILSGILYTGGPWPLAYVGLGDLFVLLFFGFGATVGTYWIHTHSLNLEIVLAAIPPGLLATAILVVNHLRDRHTDAQAGKRTLVVRWGPGFARWEYLFCILVAVSMPLLLFWYTGFQHPGSLLACAILWPAWTLLKKVWTLDADPALNPVLGQTNQLLLLYSLLFSVGWLLS